MIDDYCGSVKMNASDEKSQRLIITLDVETDSAAFAQRELQSYRVFKRTVT